MSTKRSKLEFLKDWFKQWKWATMITCLAAIVGIVFQVKSCTKENDSKTNYVDLYIGPLKIGESVADGDVSIILYLYPGFEITHDTNTDNVLDIWWVNNSEENIKDLSVYVQVSKEKRPTKYKDTILASNTYPPYNDMPLPIVRNIQVAKSSEMVSYHNIGLPTGAGFNIPELFWASLAKGDDGNPDLTYIDNLLPKDTIFLIDLIPYTVSQAYANKKSRIHNVGVSVVSYNGGGAHEFLKAFSESNSPFMEIATDSRHFDDTTRVNYSLDFTIIDAQPNMETVQVDPDGGFTLYPEDFRYYKCKYKTNYSTAKFEILDEEDNITRIDYKLDPKRGRMKKIEGF